VFGSLFHGKLIIPALWLGLWNGFVQVGTAMGSILAGWSQDRFGRRAAFGIGGLIATAGSSPL
jgi:SP family general alpha glucoside:H+ symporter-like MFS transporter